MVYSYSSSAVGKDIYTCSVDEAVSLQGISHEVRAEVWPFLLGYYSFDSTSEERTEIDEEKRCVKN